MTIVDPVVAEIVGMRRDREWSQRELARRAGIVPSTLCVIESGERSPTLTTLRKLTAALELDVTLRPLDDRCAALGPTAYPYRCVRNAAHDGRHGYAGVFW